jgi:aconitate decarboxylase
MWDGEKLRVSLFDFKFFDIIRVRHITSSCGSIGAAVAVSKALGSSTKQTAHAIGLAATQVTGLREMFGSHTKSFHPGRAAQSGLLAAVMAHEGYTSSESALEAKRGWANVVGATKTDVQQNLDKWTSIGGNIGLASGETGRWEILRNSFKPFPCGIVIHPSIDACVQLHHQINERGLDPQRIAYVKADVHPLVLELTGKKTPKDGLEAKFSVYHSGACALLLGKATPAEYEDSVVLDPNVIAIRDRIVADVDPALEPQQARVCVVLDNGEILDVFVEHAIGSVLKPMSDEMLEKKFIDQATGVTGEQAQAASKACWGIGTASDVASIF